jgi:SHS2 domain-containing protein
MEKYETFSTTADVGIRIVGEGFYGLYRSAVKGINLLYFGEEIIQDLQSSIRVEAYPYEFYGDACENVLVNLLGEIVFLLQAQNKATMGIDIKEADDTFIKADLLTIPCQREPEIEIKSVTYHNLHVEDRDGGKAAEVIFDV